MRVFSDIIRPNISTSLQQYHLEKYEITFHTVGFVINEISPELKYAFENDYLVYQE